MVTRLPCDLFLSLLTPFGVLIIFFLPILVRKDNYSSFLIIIPLFSFHGIDILCNFAVGFCNVYIAILPKRSFITQTRQFFKGVTYKKYFY